MSIETYFHIDDIVLLFLFVFFCLQISVFINTQMCVIMFNFLNNIPPGKKSCQNDPRKVLQKHDIFFVQPI